MQLIDHILVRKQFKDNRCRKTLVTLRTGKKSNHFKSGESGIGFALAVPCLKPEKLVSVLENVKPQNDALRCLLIHAPVRSTTLKGSLLHLNPT